jgi:hypothetical protein
MKRTTLLAVCVAAATTLGAGAASAQPARNDSLDLTMVLLPEGATGAEEISRRIELPPAAASRDDNARGEPPGDAGNGSETAEEARERGREFGRDVANEAQENRENAGRGNGNEPGPPPDRGPPDNAGPPGSPDSPGNSGSPGRPDPPPRP